MVKLKNVKVEKREVKGSHTQILITNHDPGKNTVAKVFNTRGDRHDADELAQLFAAAPELLEALKTAKNYLQTKHGEQLAEINGAILKAERTK